MKRIRINRKKAALAVCAAIPAALAAVFISRAVKANKSGRRASY